MLNLNYAMEQVFDNDGCKKLTCKIIQKKVDLKVARAESSFWMNRSLHWGVRLAIEPPQIQLPSHQISSYRATAYPTTKPYIAYPANEPLHIQLPNHTSHIQLPSHRISNY